MNVGSKLKYLTEKGDFNHGTVVSRFIKDGVVVALGVAWPLSDMTSGYADIIKVIDSPMGVVSGWIGRVEITEL